MACSRFGPGHGTAALCACAARDGTVRRLARAPRAAPASGRQQWQLWQVSLGLAARPWTLLKVGEGLGSTNLPLLQDLGDLVLERQLPWTIVGDWTDDPTIDVAVVSDTLSGHVVSHSPACIAMPRFAKPPDVW